MLTQHPLVIRVTDSLLYTIQSSVNATYAQCSSTILHWPSCGSWWHDLAIVLVLPAESVAGMSHKKLPDQSSFDTTATGPPQSRLIHHAFQHAQRFRSSIVLLQCTEPTIQRAQEISLGARHPLVFTDSSRIRQICPRILLEAKYST